MMVGPVQYLVSLAYINLCFYVCTLFSIRGYFGRLLSAILEVAQAQTYIIGNYNNKVQSLLTHPAG